MTPPAATARSTALAVVAAMVLAGCVGSTPEAHDGDPGAGPTTAAPVALRLGTPVRLPVPADADAGEFHAVRDPTDPDRLLVGVIGRTCDAYLSEDGGTTWRDVSPPWTADRLDPWVSIDANGGFHMMCMDGDRHLTHSTDAGATWSEPVRIPETGWDRPVFHAASNGTWYHCSTKDGGPHVRYSLDNGTSWHTAQFDWVRGGCDEIVETPAGDIVATYHRFDTLPYLGVGSVRSTNGGSSWSFGAEHLEQWTHYGRNPACETLFEPGGYDTEEQLYTVCLLATGVAPNGQPAGWILPSWTVDPRTGDLYVAFGSHRETLPTTGWYELRVFRSPDLGDTWRPVDLPVEAAPCGDCHVYRPTVAFDDAGNLGLQWKRGTATVPNEHWFAVRPAGNESWLAATVFDTTEHPVHEYDGGLHYWELVGLREGFQVFWLDRDGVDTPHTLWSMRAGYDS